MLLFDSSFWNIPQVLPLVVVPKNEFHKSHIKFYQLEAIQFLFFLNQPQSQHDNTKRNAILFVSPSPTPQLQFSQQVLQIRVKLHSLWDCYIDENFEVGPQGIPRLFQGWEYLRILSWFCLDGGYIGKERVLNCFLSLEPDSSLCHFNLNFLDWNRINEQRKLIILIRKEVKTWSF